MDGCGNRLCLITHFDAVVEEGIIKVIMTIIGCNTDAGNNN